MLGGGVCKECVNMCVDVYQVCSGAVLPAGEVAVVERPASAITGWLREDPHGRQR